MLAESLGQSLRFFGVIMAELAVLFVVVSALVSLARQYVSEERIRKLLTRRWGTGNLLGAALGSLTPFCSFSTIPVLIGLLRSGAPFGAAISFLFASPLANPVVLGLFLVLFGWRVMVVYAALGISLAVLAGVLWDLFGLEKYVRVRTDAADRADEKSRSRVGRIGSVQRLGYAAAEGWTEFRGALPYLLTGVAVGAVIHGFVPSDWIVTVAGPENPFAIPVAAAVGAPLYIWPETMLPIGAALIEKGMGIGTLMALVVGGAGASIPEVTVLGAVFKPPLLVLFVATILGVAITVGYVFALVF
ncbi:MAG: permease [Actinomycetota bacterium]|nr:permease [Actinomycetota bacterium]